MSRPWSHFFSFEEGVSFYIDGPWSYNGSGRTLVRTNDTLKLQMAMPEDSFFGYPIPSVDLTITLQYRNEGAGNRIVIDATVDGEKKQTFTDENAIVQSQLAKRRRNITSSVNFENQPVVLSIARETDDEVDLDLTAWGRTMDFDLERSS